MIRRKILNEKSRKYPQVVECLCCLGWFNTFGHINVKSRASARQGGKLPFILVIPVIKFAVYFPNELLEDKFKADQYERR